MTVSVSFYDYLKFQKLENKNKIVDLAPLELEKQKVMFKLEWPRNTRPYKVMCQGHDVDNIFSFLGTGFLGNDTSK